MTSETHQRGGNQKDAYEQAFRKRVAEHKEIRRFAEPGREFMYRPGQLLIAPRDLGRVVDRLRGGGHAPTPNDGFAGVERVMVDRSADVPTIVRDLRDPRRWASDQRVPSVQPHHVMVGFGNIMGDPHGAPVVACPLPNPDVALLDRGAGVTVGVCDSGIWHDAATRHPAWLGGSYTVDPGDDDPLYVHGNVLGLEGGHGTFVAGVLRQAAPGVRFDPEPALDQEGIGDEQTFAAALAGLDPAIDIVNLSFGCFTQDNLPPMTMANALATLGTDVVVVAAAGNSGQYRPSWPAAFDQVVAVTAVVDTPQGPVPADYGNYGPWVDACAVGERISTYVDGRWDVAGMPSATFTGFARWEGTSFAAPHVAGRLAADMTTNKITAAQARLNLLAQPRLHPSYGVFVK